MTFTEKSGIVQSYVILVLAGKRTLDPTVTDIPQVPNTGNLREMVAQVLTN